MISSHRGPHGTKAQSHSRANHFSWGVLGLLLVACSSSLLAQGEDAAIDPEKGRRELTFPAFDPQAIDATAEPCVDFYQYACGGWHAANPMPRGESFWSRPFTQFARQVDEYVRSLIEQAAVESAERTPDEQKIGDYYTACMDTAAIEERGLAPLRPELAVIDSMRSIKELPAVLGSLHRMLPWYPQDGEPLLYFDARVDPGGQVVGLRLGASGIGLQGPDYYVPNDQKGAQILVDYQEHIASMLALIGEPEDDARRHAEAVLALETLLASAYLPKSEARNNAAATINPMPLAELQALTPEFDWVDFLRAHGLPAGARFNVKEPAYFRAINRWLRDLPLESWKAYLRWQLVSERAKLLPASLRQVRFDFYGRNLLGLEAPPDRAQTCIEALEIDLPGVLGRLFIERVWQPEMASRTRSLFSEIQTAMQKRIKRAEWLAPETRREALAKVEATRLSLGHPERWLDDRRVVIRRDDHYGNVQRTGEAMRRVSFDRVGRPPNLDWWDEPVTWVGGYYESWNNAIVITAPMMLFLDPREEDPAVLYGGIALMLAHELIHGFDPNGRGHDASGSLRDWWTQNDAAHFDARAQCVAEQFSRLEYAPGIPIDGSFVVSEQFTELSAHAIAWQAYLDSIGQRPQPESAGLSAHQRFFVTAAQTWCAVATEGRWRAMAAGASSKAWAEPMVHGTVQNLPDFAKTFGCLAGQPMVKPAEEVCRGW